MSSAGGSGTTLALDDIQGLILRGYSYPYIRHVIFRISRVTDDPRSDCREDAVAGVRRFLGALLPSPDAPLCITSARQWTTPPPCCLNVALMATGLKALLGAPRFNQISGNSSQVFGPFAAGAAARAARVGDTSTSAPANWWKNGNWKLPTPATTDGLDLVASLYAKSPAERERFGAMLLDLIPSGDGGPAMRAAFVQDADPLLDTAGDPSALIHFGYRDGISQPRIAGTPWDDPGDPDDDSPCVPSWLFVLSHGAPVYTVDPLLVNGCFGAFRLLHQDVAAFESFLRTGADPELLAAKMCGRWRDGTPLEVSPEGPDGTLSELDLVNFNYLAPSAHQKGPRESDDLGGKCPYASHTRRSNPRDDNKVLDNNNPVYPFGQRHRVRRFATPYGPPYTPETADAQRGLVGWFMGADLSQQFEFVMKTWISNGGFRPGNDRSPNDSGLDPLFGPHPNDGIAAHKEFDYLEASGKYRVVPGLQRFVRTDGGLYGFFPSLSALRQLSAAAATI